MTSFFLAIQFLTIIPLKIKNFSEKKAARSVAYFPLVGLCLGLTLLVVSILLNYFFFMPLASSVVLVILLVIFTGGMHLDGLADTFDALASHKNREEMLALMRDPNIGVMGAVSIISVLLLKIILLSVLDSPLRESVLLLMCMFSRWALVLAMLSFTYARKEGKAGVFMRGMNKKAFFIASSLALLIGLFILQWKAVLILLAVGGFTYLFGKFVARKIGGITGDTLGAVAEISEVIVLLCAIFLLGGRI